MRNLLPKLLVLAATALPIAAHADPIDNFTITGDSNTYTFTLPEQFTFAVPLHLVTVPTLTTTGTIDGVGGKTFDVTFFTGIGDPGESLTFNNITLAGPILISPVSSSGNFDTAAIDPGSYQLIDFANSSKGPDYYTLTIIPEAGRVPEPSTLPLLATGTLGVLSLARQRRRRVPPV